MKTPSKDEVAAIVLRKRINDKIDQAIATGKRHRQSEFEIDLLDKVFRPFCHLLHAEKDNPVADSNEVRDSVAAFAANLLIEMLVNIAERDDGDEAINQGNIMLRQLVEHFNSGVMVNYGLTSQPVHAKVSESKGD